jgi:hypothetical protein
MRGSDPPSMFGISCPCMKDSATPHSEAAKSQLMISAPPILSPISRTSRQKIQDYDGTEESRQGFVFIHNAAERKIIHHTHHTEEGHSCADALEKAAAPGKEQAVKGDRLPRCSLRRPANRLMAASSNREPQTRGAARFQLRAQHAWSGVGLSLEV